MRKEREIFRRYRFDMQWAIIMIVLFSVFFACVVFAVSPISMDVLKSLFEWGHFIAPVLNWLPILLCMLLLYFVTSNVVASIGAIGFVVTLMAVVNRVKLDMRGDPLVHWDLALISEVVGIANALSPGLVTRVLVGCGAFAVLLAVLGVWINSGRLPIKTRAIGAGACAAAMLVCNLTLYSNAALEQGLPTWGSFYNMADVHNSKGNLYSFIYGWNTSRAARPEGYDPAEMHALAQAYAEPEPTLPQARPHIVMVMGEALSALSESPAVDLTGYTDPLAGFKALGEAGTMGSIVVPSRGGGTADTEFDVFTARPSRFLRNAPYAYRMLTGPTEAMPGLLGGIGYRSIALHPGYGWFYNRQNIYPYLGFDEAVFEDAFPREAYLDTFISEEATYDMLLSMLDAHFATSGDPLFAWCLTIQNHAAYYNRYLPEGTYNFTPTVPMSAEERNTLSNYFAGVADADRELLRLAEYLEALQEPAIIVCFGDHLPSLDEALYDVLIPGSGAKEGSFLAQTCLHTVPFIIWPNTAAREQTDILARMEQAVMPENGVISSNYLGAYVMELLGYEGLSPYFDYVNELRTVLPVVQEKHAYDMQGQEAAGQALAGAKQLRRWAYYLQTEQ